MVFGKLFGKKEEPVKSAMDMTILDLEEGCILDYYMKSWTVSSAYEYDWGNNFFSNEYLLDSGDEKVYLHVENDEEIECSVSREVPIRKIDENLKEHLVEYEEPPKTLTYNGKKYYRDAENLAHVRKLGEDDASELVSWEYVDEDEKEFISINRWSESSIEAYVGNTVAAYEITNILPKQKID